MKFKKIKYIYILTYVRTKLLGVTLQNTLIFIVTAVRNLNVTFILFYFYFS